MSMKCFVVVAYRLGQASIHYVVGAFKKYEKAQEACKKEQSYRGDKYDCYIFETEIVDEWKEDIERCFMNEDWDLSGEIRVLISLKNLIKILDEEEKKLDEAREKFDFLRLRKSEK